MQRTTRRTLLRTATAAVGLGLATTTYAAVIEPGFRLIVREHRLALPGWGARPPLSVCVLTDLHACEPWMPLDRIRRIVAFANALRPDLHAVLGDFVAHHRFTTGPVPIDGVMQAMAGLSAPLGRYAILGNHDWWDDKEVQRTKRGPPAMRGLLERAGLPVLVNAATRLPHGAGVWLLGTDSMLAFGRRGPGADNLPRAIAPLMADDAPAILLAHEPDLFPRMPGRIALMLSGHTHGGQVRLLGYSPIVPSVYGNRYAYGRVEEGGRQLVVSGGLGCSIAPVRLGVPPELTLVRIG